MGKKFNKDHFKKIREEASKSYYDVPALNWGSLIDGKYTVENRYEFKWKFLSGSSKIPTIIPCDLQSYVLNFKQKCNDDNKKVSAFIGCDSQGHMSFTRFIICLCLKVDGEFNGNGVHVLIAKMDLPKIYDYRYRLLKETDISVEFARNYRNFFIENGMPLTIHSDYNNMTNHKSNGVVTEASNFAKTHGFQLIIKPDGWSASYGADRWC